jgi:hypothetical protein
MSDDDPFVRARHRLIDEGRALLLDHQSTGDFFRAFMGLVRDLSGEDGLAGTDLDLFQRLEAWEQAVGDDKVAVEAGLRATLAKFVPPDTYQHPIIAWLVEYSDAREPGLTFQAGAFTSEAEARRLLERLESDDWRSDLHLNTVAVHQNLEDWEWDR